MIGGDTGFPNGILDGLLEQTNFPAWRQIEHLHYLLACDGVGPRAIIVAGLKVYNLLTDKAEIVEETLFADLILGGDVGLA